jgi:hypothetical protein
MATGLESVGAQPRNPSRGRPIHIARIETGLVTNRNALHDPAQFVISKFYGGYVDALIDGSNMEISNQLTLTRRPGLSQFSSVTVPNQPNWFYDWRTLDQGIKVIVDTSAASYIQTPTTQTQIFTKSAGAGQGYYQGVADTLYVGDGVDLQKFILPGGTTWNWGIKAPSAAPSVVSTASGSAATLWQANTFFTTMGLTVDSFGQVWQLIGVNRDGTNSVNAQFGTAGNGSPTWNQTLYGTTTEAAGTPIVWQNDGQISQWQASFNYGDAGVNGQAAPVGIFDPTSQSIYLNLNHNGGLSQSGTVKPAFSGVPGSSFWDNGAHWFFLCTYPGVGSVQAQPWKQSTSYAHWYTVAGVAGNHANTNCAIEPFLFPPPANQPIYLQVPTNTGTSGSGYAPFQNVGGNAGIGLQQPDAQLNWLCLGSATWLASHTYNAWTVQGTTFGCIKDTNGNMQVCVQTGLSSALIPGTTITPISAANASGGNTVYTGTFPTPFTVGAPAVVTGFTNAANNGSYKVVASSTTTVTLDNANGVTEGAVGTIVYNPWGTLYGNTITDGGIKWVCVGPQITWVAGSGTTGIWNLPLSGWQPPMSSQNFGGSIINSTNSLVEATVVPGKSGTVQPTWTALGTNISEGTALILTAVGVSGSTVTYTGTITGGAANAFAGFTFLILGFTVPGNNGLISVTSSTATTLVCTLNQQQTETHAGTAQTGLIWFAESNVSTVSLAWTKGIQYAYSFEARTATDQFNTIAPPGGGTLGNPGALGAPTGSGSGGISTASPRFIITGANVGAVNTVSGVGSTDSQADTIVLWRTLDGGSTLFFLTEFAAPPPIGGIAQPWHWQDFLADSFINQFIPAPINHQNDPPPVGFLPMAYHFQRIWGAVGNFVFVSGGPDVVTGNGNESFNPNNFFQFPSPVTRIVPTATGVLVFLTSDVYGILGGPIFNTFFPTPMVPGVGLLHFNALDIHGGVIYLYSADNQVLSMDPSGGVQRIGGAIADKLALFDATKVFVTVHESGNDNAIFVGDGSTGWFRLNPNQFPNGSPVWSPFATITGGAGAVLSIETAPGVHRLLVGGVGSNTPILKRDSSTFQDNGTSYSCFFTMGSINVCNPGQIAGLTFINVRATRVGTTPTVAFLLNEVSGSFTTFPQSQAYPWQIFGAILQPTSLFSNAYYFRAAGVPALAEHLQVKVSFPVENFANEVLSLTIFGVIEQPPEE